MNEASRNMDTAKADGTTAPVACWLCRGPVAAGALFCPTCRAVQPPAPVDHFARFGLPVAFDLDENELDRRYFAVQRQLHPDRFATRTARERAVSQSQAVAVNEAYETLKDPLARAEYLLQLHGVATEACQTISDPELLMEQMERREALSEIDTREAAEAFLDAAGRDVAASLATIAVAFGRGDLTAARRETTRLKYLTKLVEEARARRARLGGRPEAPILRTMPR